MQNVLDVRLTLTAAELPVHTARKVIVSKYMVPEMEVVNWLASARSIKKEQVRIYALIEIFTLVEFLRINIVVVSFPIIRLILS
jgi:hypothetical protein